MLGSGSTLASCSSDEIGRYICGVVNAEDLVRLAHSRWVIASGANGPGVPAGQLFLINAKTREAKAILPLPDSRFRHHPELYAECSDKPQQDKFVAGGINVRRTGERRYTLYVVHHGERESVEIFDIDARGARPELTWVGCVQMPSRPDSNQPWLPNAVTSLPDDAFAVTVNPAPDPADPAYLEKLISGQIKGLVLVWSPRHGWREVLGSELAGNNGIESSPDGRWLYVNASFEPAVHRLSLAPGHADHRVIPTTFNPDNLRWGDDGLLYVAGPTDHVQEALLCAATQPSCAIPYKVVRIDPRTLTVDELIDEPGSAVFGLATGVAKVGNEVWVSTVRGTRIATFPLE